MTDADRSSLLQALDSLGPGATPPLIPGNLSSLGGSAGLGSVFNATHGAVWISNSSGLWAAPGNGSWRNASGSGSQLLEESDKGNQYWVLILLLVPALTIFGNILVVLSVCRERSLQSATNYFIVSLAFADILVAAIVMPVSVVVEVRDGRWDFSNLMCDLWIMCDALFSTASILNLVAISIDRFIAVTMPIKYAKHKNSKRTHFTIAVTWLLSIGIALPIGCGLQNMQGLRFRQEFKQVCTFYNGDFLIYSSLGSFYIPCIVMLVLYYRIFNVIRTRAKKAPGSSASKKLQTASKKQQLKQQKEQKHQLKQQQQQQSSLRTISSNQTNHCSPADHNSPGSQSKEPCLGCQTGGIYTGEQPLPHSCRQTMTGSQNLPGPSNSDNSGGAQSDGGGSTGGGGGKASSLSKKKKQQLFQQLKLRKRASNKTDNRSAARREKKATKTLAIVLGVFLFCWLPFFITNLMWAACLKNIDDLDSLGIICKYDRRINVLLVWLGYVNSFLNPLIYTIFNTEFRKAFKKLLHID